MLRSGLLQAMLSFQRQFSSKLVTPKVELWSNENFQRIGICVGDFICLVNGICHDVESSFNVGPGISIARIAVSRAVCGSDIVVANAVRRFNVRAT